MSTETQFTTLDEWLDTKPPEFRPNGYEVFEAGIIAGMAQQAQSLAGAERLLNELPEMNLMNLLMRSRWALAAFMDAWAHEVGDTTEPCWVNANHLMSEIEALAGIEGRES